MIYKQNMTLDRCKWLIADLLKNNKPGSQDVLQKIRHTEFMCLMLQLHGVKLT